MLVIELLINLFSNCYGNDLSHHIASFAAFKNIALLNNTEICLYTIKYFEILWVHKVIK